MSVGKVSDRLRGDGFTVASGIGGTGVPGVLANGSGPVVLLRCELDGLPLREDTGAAYASTAAATDASGHEAPADHACGHDMMTVGSFAP
jgi:hippurate hydrolase